MQTKLTSWLSLIALFALFTAPIFGQTPPSVTVSATQAPGTIRIKRLVGSVVAEDIVTKAKMELKNEDVIGQGTIVRTGGGNSSVVLLFSNGASINLNHDSELNIETFTQDPFAENSSFRPENATEEPSVSTTSIKLTKGELIGNVKKLKKGGSVESKFTVSTPVGAAGIRGTTFRITYRPDGNGRYNFILTTIEGNVQLTVASGTVSAPPVSVTDNKEVIITNVEVNVVNNQVTATTATGQTATVTAAPVPVVDAPVTTVQQVQVVAAQLVQAVANVVFTTPATVVTPKATPPPPTPTPDKQPDPTPQPSPGATSKEPRITTP
jgi:hypothetical protein